MKITKCTYGWIKRLATCDHCANLPTTAKYITNIYGINLQPFPIMGNGFGPGISSNGSA